MYAKLQAVCDPQLYAIIGLPAFTVKGYPIITTVDAGRWCIHVIRHTFRIMRHVSAYILLKDALLKACI